LRANGTAGSKGYTERHKYDRRPHRRDPAELSSPSVSYRQLDDGKTLDDDGPVSAATHQNLVKAAGQNSRLYPVGFAGLRGALIGQDRS